MSIVSNRLASRVVCAPDTPPQLADTDTHRDHLANLLIGHEATISGFSTLLEPAIARRLFDLGFVPGTSVIAARRAPLRDPIVYRVSGVEVALRRSEAGGIQICDSGRATSDPAA